jgi:RNA polymerase sigma-70 factor (ECF subfamily)
MAGSGYEADPDANLVEAARQGDRRAFDVLVCAYQPRLRGFLARRVGPEAVDDLLQDIWLACWVALPRFNRRSRFKTWLYGIALHKCTDHHRARGRAARAAASDNTDRSWQSVEDLYASAELKETVQALLLALPPAQREVLEMYYYAELTLPEVAKVLGRNLNTVKYQFYRAHAQVARELDAPGKIGT